jgi:hypothetical protein
MINANLEQSFTIQNVIANSKNFNEFDKNLRNFFEFHFYEGKGDTLFKGRDFLRLEKLSNMINTNLSHENIILESFFSLKFYLFHGLEGFSDYSKMKNIIIILYELLIKQFSKLRLKRLYKIQSLLPKITFQNEVIVLLFLLSKYYLKIDSYIISYFNNQNENAAKLIMIKNEIHIAYQNLYKRINS